MALLFDGCKESIQVVVFSKGNNIGITSSTCRLEVWSLLSISPLLCIVKFVIVYM